MKIDFDCKVQLYFLYRDSQLQISLSTIRSSDHPRHHRHIQSFDRRNIRVKYVFMLISGQKLIKTILIVQWPAQCRPAHFVFLCFSPELHSFVDITMCFRCSLRTTSLVNGWWYNFMIMEIVPGWNDSEILICGTQFSYANCIHIVQRFLCRTYIIPIWHM